MRKAALFYFVIVCVSICAADPTVVCIHGFMRGKYCMKALEYKLERKGVDAINWLYPSKKKLIAEHAEDLVVQLNKIAEEKPSEEINFVTHSLGGIILRAALNHPECPIEARCGRAVLIAPPNQGALLARKLRKFGPIKKWLGHKAGKELMEAEEGGFDRFGQFPPDVKVLVIAGTLGGNPLLHGPNDGKVLTSETRLSTPHEYWEIKAGHSWITYHPAVIDKCLNFMELH